MAAKYIEKTHTKKLENGEKEVVTTKYRVDPDFVPTKVTDICTEFVEAYCVANNETDWLCEKYEATAVGKDGKERPYPFTSIRTDFCKKFFPTLVAGDKKATNFRAAFLAKYKK